MRMQAFHSAVLFTALGWLISISLAATSAQTDSISEYEFKPETTVVKYKRHIHGAGGDDQDEPDGPTHWPSRVNTYTISETNTSTMATTNSFGTTTIKSTSNTDSIRHSLPGRSNRSNRHRRAIKTTFGIATEVDPSVTKTHPSYTSANRTSTGSSTEDTRTTNPPLPGRTNRGNTLQHVTQTHTKTKRTKTVVFTSTILSTEGTRSTNAPLPGRTNRSNRRNRAAKTTSTAGIAMDMMDDSSVICRLWGACLSKPTPTTVSTSIEDTRSTNAPLPGRINRSNRWNRAAKTGLAVGIATEVVDESITTPMPSPSVSPTT